MTKHVSILIAGLALAFAAPALGAGPAASVAGTTSAFSALGSTIIRFEDDGTDPTSTFDLYAPQLYGAELTQPIGATIGTVDGQATLADQTTIRLSGLVKTLDPAAHAAEAAICTPGRLLHDALWTVGLNAGGTAYGPLLVFADRGASGDPFAAHLRACFRDPTASGFRVTRATLTVNGVFTNPAAEGEYRWTAIMRTFTAPSLPFQSQTIVRLPPRLTLTHKVIRANGRRFIRLSGRVTENGLGVNGVRVAVLYGRRASSLSRLAYATTFGGGKYAVVAPLRGKTVYRATISGPLRAGPVSKCETFAPEPAALCTALTFAPFSAQTPSFTVTPRM